MGGLVNAWGAATEAALTMMASKGMGRIRKGGRNQVRPPGGLQVDGALSGQDAKLDGADALANNIRKILQHGR